MGPLDGGDKITPCARCQRLRISLAAHVPHRLESSPWITFLRIDDENSGAPSLKMRSCARPGGWRAR